jgi:hypothetical protein
VIAALLWVALAAAPKDCHDDRACFDAAAKSCTNATYTLTNESSVAGMTCTNVVTFSVEGPKKTGCGIQMNASVRDVHVSAEGVAMVKKNAGPDEAGRLEKMVIDGVKNDPKRHVQCVLPPTEISRWMDEKLTVPDHFSRCVSLTCGPKPVLAAGCTLGDCSYQGWRMTCGKSECFVNPVTIAQPHIVSFDCHEFEGESLLLPQFESDLKKK